MDRLRIGASSSIPEDHQTKINATIEASRSRISEIHSTSSAHFNQTIVRFSNPLFCLFLSRELEEREIYLFIYFNFYDSFEDVKLQLSVYEDNVFGKVKGVFH